jgi:hypothetical protein
MTGRGLTVEERRHVVEIYGRMRATGILSREDANCIAPLWRDHQAEIVELTTIPRVRWGRRD